MTDTLITVGMPVFNGAEFIRTAIESILGQTWGDLQLIIADNASTDATEEICREYAAQDDRVEYVRRDENVGASMNYSSLAQMATTPYFKWASHDDSHEPNHIEACMRKAAANPAAVLVFPRTALIDEHGNHLERYDGDLELTDPSPAQRATQLVAKLELCNIVYGVMRRDALLGTRLLQPFTNADEVLVFEMALRGTFVAVPEYLYLRRMHDRISLKANTSDSDRSAWYDPNRSGRRWYAPRMRVLSGHLTAIAESPLPITEKVKAEAMVTTAFTRRWWRNMGGEVKRTLVAATS